jgi:hypothetical protein
VRHLFAPIALFLLGCFVVAGVWRGEPAKAASNDIETQVSRFVSGILGYARWPTLTGTYRFCMAGGVRHLRDAQSSLTETKNPVSVRQLAVDEADWTANCDVLYVGPAAPGQRGRLLAEAVGKPVLTISEGDNECVESSMFCLTLEGNEVGLIANLDAISRSGIRINPKVLQLVRRKQDKG